MRGARLSCRHCCLRSQACAILPAFVPGPCLPAAHGRAFLLHARAEAPIPRLPPCCSRLRRSHRRSESTRPLCRRRWRRLPIWTPSPRPRWTCTAWCGPRALPGDARKQLTHAACVVPPHAARGPPGWPLPSPPPAQVLEAGGSELAVAITAAALALADAGIELFDLVSACSVVRARSRQGCMCCAQAPCSRARPAAHRRQLLCSLPDCGWCCEPRACESLCCIGAVRECPCPVQSRVEGSLLLDPSADEAHREDAGLLLAFMPTCNEVRPRVNRGTRLENTARARSWVHKGQTKAAARRGGRRAVVVAQAWPGSSLLELYSVQLGLVVCAAEPRGTVWWPRWLRLSRSASMAACKWLGPREGLFSALLGVPLLTGHSAGEPRPVERRGAQGRAGAGHGRLRAAGRGGAAVPARGRGCGGSKAGGGRGRRCRTAAGGCMMHLGNESSVIALLTRFLWHHAFW